MTQQAQNEYTDGRLKANGAYQKVSAHVKDWLEIHKGETFNLDTICRQLDLAERDHRKYVAIELSRKISQGKLEKVSNIYRYIDNTRKCIDWVHAPDQTQLDIRWPYGAEDQSAFGFDGHVVISPGDIIVIAGVSNMGKTTFCLNFLWENMDTYPCQLMGNEYTAGKFKRRVGRMLWKEPLKEDGNPKFTLVERREGWKDIIEPNSINIIDWINLGDNFYQMGAIIEGIQAKLNEGIALISIQKDANKNLGLGGGFSQHLASLYLSIDFERLTVVKAKEWHDVNPNGQMHGFEIIDGGSKFHNIRPVKKCPKCWGRSVTNGTKCDSCFGKGYIDA